MTILKFTETEVEQEKYVIIQNKVYDVHSFVASHPGGDVIKTYLGQEATVDAFNAFHPPSAQEVLANFHVGDLEYSRKQSAFGRDVEQLRHELYAYGLFESSKIYYAFKVLGNYAILGSSVWLALNQWTVLSAVVLGVFWQQSGWLAHDFLHHQVFKNRRVNDFVGYLLGNLGQGFSVEWWKNKHNTHHAKPNIHGEDPDIDTMPFLGWSTYSVDDNRDLKGFSKWMLYNQRAFYFLLLSLARLSWALQSFQHALLRSKLRLAEASTIILHWTWYAWMVSLAPTVSYRLLFVVVSQATCGLLLALVFSLNHNGMPIFKKDESKDMDFYEMQVLTGRDVYPTLFADWFTGGLNHQIEHHLFPMLPRHNFYKIRSRVKELCDRHGVTYHLTGLIDGTVEVLEKLTQIQDYAKCELK